MLQLLWEMFEKSGGINEYLFYKAYKNAMDIDEIPINAMSTNSFENVETETSIASTSTITQLGS